MSEVGLPYLTLDRRADTLSGGEAQRIRLAAQLGSNLRGVCYILDEPTIGLHPRDNAMLLNTLRRLEQLGNSVLVVEHDEATIQSADLIIDLGPGAGVHGGNVVSIGTPAEIRANPDSPTGAYLRSERKRLGPERELKKSQWLTIRGAKAHNLKNLDVKIPLGMWSCITGISGSGKSTLVRDVLYKGLKLLLGQFAGRPGPYKEITGWQGARTDRRSRSNADRQNAALGAGVLRRRAGRDPQALRAGAGSAPARLHAEPFFVQRQRRPLRGVRRPGQDSQRDEFPSRMSSSTAKPATASASTKKR